MSAAALQWRSSARARSSAPLLTVFTPTFDRAGYLSSLAQSMREQTFPSFEWLVVDDGSMDGTEQVLDALVHDERLAVRVARQERRGKHAAWNRAVEASRGSALVCIDSDDEPVDADSLARMWADFTRLSARCGCPVSVVYYAAERATGRRIGDPFPPGTDDDGGTPTTYRRLFYEAGSAGDRHSIDPVAQLRAAPFPEPDVTRFAPCSNVVPESVVWFGLPGPVVPVARVELSKQYLAGGLSRAAWTAEQQPGLALSHAIELDRAGAARLRHPVRFTRDAAHLARFRRAHPAARRDPAWQVRSRVGRAYLAVGALLAPLVPLLRRARARTRHWAGARVR